MIGNGHAGFGRAASEKDPQGHLADVVPRPPARPASAATLYERQEGLPDHVLQIASRAQHRLYRVHKRMRERKKPGNVITVACARELACFLWAAATAP